MLLMLIGVVEMIIITLWTRFVTERRVLASGVVTMINILIWYYVLEQVVNDLGNWRLIITYAFGCVLGTMLATKFNLDSRPLGSVEGARQEG